MITPSLHFLFALFALLSLFTGCGRPVTPSVSTSIILKGFQSLAVMNGGALIYGQATDAANNFALSVADGSNLADINLKIGTYTFYAIGWEGPEKFEGNLRCATATVNVTGDITSVPLVLTRANCDDARFSPISDRTGSGDLTVINSLTINGCQTLDQTVVGSLVHASACDETNPNVPYIYRGTFRSYRVRMKTFNSSSPDLVSICYSSAVGSNTSNVITNARIPVSSSTVFPVEIIGYRTFDCSEPSLNNNTDNINFASYSVYFPSGLITQYSGVDVLKIPGAGTTNVLIAESESGSGFSPFASELPLAPLIGANGAPILNNLTFTSVPVRAYAGSTFANFVPNTAQLYDLSCTITSNPALVSSATCTCNHLNCSYNYSTTTYSNSSGVATFSVLGRTTSGSIVSQNESLTLGFVAYPNDGATKFIEYLTNIVGWPSPSNPRQGHGSRGDMGAVLNMLSANSTAGFLHRYGFTTCSAIGPFNLQYYFNGGSRVITGYGSTADINPFTLTAFDKKIVIVDTFLDKTQTMELSLKCGGANAQGLLKINTSGVEQTIPYTRKNQLFYNMTTVPVIHSYEKEVRNTTEISRRYSRLEKYSNNDLRLWSINSHSNMPGAESMFGALSFIGPVIYTLSEMHATNTSTIVPWNSGSLMDRFNGPNYATYAANNLSAGSAAPGFATPNPILNSRNFDTSWMRSLDYNSSCVQVTTGTGSMSAFDCDF